MIKTAEYSNWLKGLKLRVRQAQIKAAVQVNTTLLEFYWQLGAEIVERQKTAEWGSGFLKQLSQDLMAEFPDMKGFSYRNLKYIRQWYLFYIEDLPHKATACCPIENQSDGAIENVSHPVQKLGQQPVAEFLKIPWGHNIAIISKCESVEEALYYVNKTIEHSWSRSVLVHQVESCLLQREGKAITNFANALPAPQSDLAQQLIKDPYNFDFLALTEDYSERELEKALIDHIARFLLEFGAVYALIELFQRWLSWLRNMGLKQCPHIMHF